MMAYKKNIFITLLLISLGAWSNVSAQAKSETSKPNIVFILADDLTFRDIGCYGSKNVKTPNIDAIAKEGMKFNRCFQAAPMCSPTRHNIYTGIYPVKSGAYPQSTFVKEGTKSVVHYLKKEGYRVALTGKRHIAPAESFPFEYLGENGSDPDLDMLKKFISGDKDQPFCSFVCYKEPHTPWNLGDPGIYDPDKIELPPYFVDTKETRETIINYYAEINHLDNSVGEVRKLLDDLGVAENTILIFTGEQGNAFPFAKWTCYDNGLQTAFLVRWPGKIKAGSVSDAMIEYVDVTPTFVDIAGGTPKDAFDGKSFLPVLMGEKNEHKKYVYGIQTTRGIRNGSKHYGIRSIRSEKYKYILNIHHDSKFQNNVTEQKNPVWTGFWLTWQEKAKTDENAAMLVNKFQFRPEVEFYDIVNDPYELNNLAMDPKYKTVIVEMG
ncbi:MAG: sulfatase, partial [Cyclobacteriaceae bacterium]|nr:sulfatase [Cyclobacteriaceae bacterium]